MDHNPFVTRNNDLFMMLLAGAGTVLINHCLLPMTVQQQFIMAFGIGFFAGLFMTYLYQSLEWALFFAVGIQLISLLPWALKLQTGVSFTLADFVGSSLQIGQYSLFLLSSWIIAIPAGFIIQRTLMGDYYKRKLL